MTHQRSEERPLLLKDQETESTTSTTSSTRLLGEEEETDASFCCNDRDDDGGDSDDAPLISTNTYTSVRDDGDDDNCDDDDAVCGGWRREATLLLNLAVPTVAIQTGMNVPLIWVASYIGLHFGAVYLDGYQLATLAGNLFTMALLQGLYTASDTLSPQAVGAGNVPRAGVVAVQGMIASLLVIVPVCTPLAAIGGTRRLLVSVMGQDTEASDLAQSWYQVYVFALPWYALYMVTWKFLAAQGIMLPLVVATTVSVVAVLPVALPLCTRYWGFAGSAMTICIFYASQALLTLLQLRVWHPHRESSWPGLRDAWCKAVERKTFSTYIYLGLGGMIASSEWVYWELVSLVVGRLGVIPLSVMSIASQVENVLFMIPLGTSIALAVRLGATIPRSVPRAKRLTLWTVLACALLFGFITLALYAFRRDIFAWFTNEPEVLDGLERIWSKMCLYYYHVSMFAISVGIATGLGMQWELGTGTLVCLFGFGLPCAWYYGSEARGGTIDVVWSWIVPPYVLMDVALYSTIFLFKDWYAVQKRVRIREGIIKIVQVQRDDASSTATQVVPCNNDDDDIEAVAVVPSTTTSTATTEYGSIVLPSPSFSGTRNNSTFVCQDYRT